MTAKPEPALMALAPALKVEIAWDEDGFWEVLVEETEEGLEEVMVKVEDAVEEGVEVVDSETFGAEEEPVVTTEEVLEETEEMELEELEELEAELEAELEELDIELEAELDIELDMELETEATAFPTSPQEFLKAV